MFSHTGHQHALEIIDGVHGSLGTTIAMQIQAARPPPPPPEPDPNLAHPEPYTPEPVSAKVRDEQVAAYRRQKTNAQKEHDKRIVAKTKSWQKQKVLKRPIHLSGSGKRMISKTNGSS